MPTYALAVSKDMDTVELLNGVWEFRLISSHCLIAWSVSVDRCDDTARAGTVQYSVEKGGGQYRTNGGNKFWKESIARGLRLRCVVMVDRSPCQRSCRTPVNDE